MSGQSVVFDFLTTGGDRTGGGFRKVADNTVLAAKGAKVLSDAIETLGQQGRPHRRRVEDAGQGPAADRRRRRPGSRPGGPRRRGDPPPRRRDAGQHQEQLGELRKALSGLKLNPGLVGPALLLAPAMATLAGAAAGAGVGAGRRVHRRGRGAGRVRGRRQAGPHRREETAAEAVGKAQDTYNAAIANGVPKAAAYKAEQLASAKAYAGMSPAQIALSKQLGGHGATRGTR